MKNTNRHSEEAELIELKTSFTYSFFTPSTPTSIDSTCCLTRCVVGFGGLPDAGDRRTKPPGRCGKNEDTIGYGYPRSRTPPFRLRPTRLYPVPSKVGGCDIHHTIGDFRDHDTTRSEVRAQVKETGLSISRVGDRVQASNGGWIGTGTFGCVRRELLLPVLQISLGLL